MPSDIIKDIYILVASPSVLIQTNAIRPEKLAYFKIVTHEEKKNVQRVKSFLKVML